MSTTPFPSISRSGFFDGQRLTASDLAGVHAAGRELRWLHNRSLHGAGVVAGMDVRAVRGERAVTVAPGYALDAAGHDLVLTAPVTLPVPPVAGPATYLVTVAHREDAELEPETRTGVCGTAGAVRLRDEPRVRMRDPVTEPAASDVVLAAVEVSACRVGGSSARERQELRAPGPYVAAGATLPGATEWRRWPDGAPVGVATTVSTAAAGFAGVPRYQARLAGDRVAPAGVGWSGLEVVLDGPVSIAAALPASFELRVALQPSVPAERLEAGLEGRTGLLNAADLLGGELPALVSAMGWHVVWAGVEG